MPRGGAGNGAPTPEAVPPAFEPPADRATNTSTTRAPGGSPSDGKQRMPSKSGDTAKADDFGVVEVREREFVRSRFPAEYEAYERNVPAFVPRPMPWRGGERSDGAPFSFALYLRHREWQAGLVFVLVMLWFAVVRPRLFS